MFRFFGRRRCRVVRAREFLSLSFRGRVSTQVRPFRVNRR